MNEHYEQELREWNVQALERIAAALETHNAMLAQGFVPAGNPMRAGLHNDLLRVALTRFKEVSDAVPPPPPPKPDIRLS